MEVGGMPDALFSIFDDITPSRSRYKDPHRDFCRRQHRIIGQYLALAAWLRGLDCIVLVRSDLEKFLGLERFKSTRVRWLEEDLKPWFPHQEAYYRTGAPSSIHSMFLSRVPMAPHLPKGPMTTELRIARLATGAPRTERFSRSNTGKEVPSEAAMVSFLSLLASGLRSPTAHSRPKAKR
jgi:hypothetical protein